MIGKLVQNNTHGQGLGHAGLSVPVSGLLLAMAMAGLLLAMAMAGLLLVIVVVAVRRLQRRGVGWRISFDVTQHWIALERWVRCTT